MVEEIGDIMIYFTNKFIYICLCKYNKEIKKLKGVFKPLKWHFKANISRYAPYPVLWCSEARLIHIKSNNVMWKDKYDTPRYECCPYIWIHLFGLNLVWYYNTNDIGYDDEYWEQALWYLYYSDCDINKARDTWPWVLINWDDPDKEKSSWDNKYLI